MNKKPMYKTGGMNNPNAAAKTEPTSYKKGGSKKGKMTMKKMGKKK